MVLLCNDSRVMLASKHILRLSFTCPLGAPPENVSCCSLILALQVERKNYMQILVFSIVFDCMLHVNLQIKGSDTKPGISKT